MWFVRGLSIAIITLVNVWAIYSATKDYIRDTGYNIGLLSTVVYTAMYAQVCYLAIVGGRLIGN